MILKNFFNSCTVSTNSGKIKGKIEDNARIFTGIPYAITNRFEFPKEVPAWKGEFDATKAGTDCWQLSSFPNLNVESSAFYEKEFPAKKDYVYADSPMCLNIIAPVDKENCPVVIFFHGGGFEVGKFDEIPFGTSTEYAKRGVILVSVGYRLNVFSFYDGQNYGLHDMLFSVDWVKKNIVSFGGNPEKITLMGQSAGAMSVMDLCYSQKLKGKIQGIIFLSGGGVIPKAVGPLPKAESAEFWQTVAKNANCDNIDELKNADPQILWFAWHSQLKKEKKMLNLMQPAIDGDIIPDFPQKIFSKNLDLDVPAIFSVTSQDIFAPVMYKVAIDYAKRNAHHNRCPVYCALFDKKLPGDKYKAFHASDLWYVFGQMKNSWRAFEKIDYDLSATIIDYYSNFIKTGNPNSKDLPQWNAITNVFGSFRHFDGKDTGHISRASCLAKTTKSLLFDKGPV